MGKKQKKKATQKEISLKSCAAANEEDITGTDCCSCDILLCASNGEDNSMDLEEVIKDQQRIFNERESAYKDLISRLKGMHDNV